MSSLFPSSDITLADASDVSCDVSHINHYQTQTQSQNVDELNDCKNGQSHSSINIRNVLIQTEKHLQIIMKINEVTFDTLVNQFQLSLLKQLKQSLYKLKIDNNNDNDFQNQDEAKQMEMMEYNEYKSNTNNSNVNVTHGSILGDGDNLTVVSAATGITGITGFTGVSSIAAPLSMNDPLVVIMGIGEYDGMNNLESVIKDYDNIIDTFLKCWKYKIFYKVNNKDNKYVYTNNINNIDNKYAIKWNGDDIHDFIEESRKHVVKNGHDGLMFFISSHGDSGRVLYDSECEQYQLDSIFSMYSSQASVLLESYGETQQESNHLLSIPKIFFLDMCRGDQKAKVTQIETQKNKTKATTMDENEKQEAKTAVIDEMKKEESKQHKKTENSEKKSHPNSIAGLAISLHNKKKEKKEETFVLKGINKEDAHKLVGQMANFSKIYANTEGFSVMGGSKHGGIFMRSVCKVFKDNKYVTNHKFTDIIFKIREYTKRDATLNNKLFNFTQIVENEGTLERQVVFGSKYINSLFASHLLLNNNNDDLGTLDAENDDLDHLADDNSQEKLCITNLSLTSTIAILVEMEQNRENRMKMFEILEKSSVNDKYNSFIENGFVIIDEKYDSHEFIKVWNEYYVTMFDLSGNDTNANILIDERKLYFDDYLYFKKNMLHTLHDKDILPKCNKVGNECHALSINNNNSNNIECRLCPTAINIDNSSDGMSFECKSCHEFLCKDCCHSLIVNRIPQDMKESKYFEIKIVNTSKTNKIAVLVNIYDSIYNKERYNMIKLKKYKKIKDYKEFADNGFVIINSDGDMHTFKTVWKSACITIVEIRNGRNALVFDRQTTFDEYPLYYISTTHDGKEKLISFKEFVPQIVGFEQKTKRSMEITFKKPLREKAIDLEFEVVTEITNGRQILQNRDSIEIRQQVKEVFYDEIKLNIDELEKEFKESQLNYNVKSLIAIDTKSKIQYSFDHAIKRIPIFIPGFDYSCTFTTLNGIGRYGPTNMEEYKGQCHHNDTRLEEGMQLWSIPKSGKYKVLCYGAKGGDSICKYEDEDENKHLLGGFGAKVGSIFKLFENDIIKIACGQKGKDGHDNAGGGGGGSYFILYKIGNKNPNYHQNQIVNIPLIIAAGGNGACFSFNYKVNGIDGLCSTSENRNNYGGYETDGGAGRGASFQNDFDIFQSYKSSWEFDYNKCNPKSFLDGAIGGERYDDYDGCDGGFGGGGGSYVEGGGGGGYIGGLVSSRDWNNEDSNKYSSYGALSYICQNENIIENVFNGTQNSNKMISGANNNNGKIEIMFIDALSLKATSAKLNVFKKLF